MDHVAQQAAKARQARQVRRASVAARALGEAAGAMSVGTWLVWTQTIWATWRFRSAHRATQGVTRVVVQTRVCRMDAAAGAKAVWQERRVRWRKPRVAGAAAPPKKAYAAQAGVALRAAKLPVLPVWAGRACAAKVLACGAANLIP